MYKIEVEFKDQKDMRYKTGGDYFWKDKDTLVFQIADQGNFIYNTAILIHELFEEALTRERGIKEDDITNFDVQFEKDRSEGKRLEEEPGMCKDAPYHKEHCLADLCDRSLIYSSKYTYEDYGNTYEKILDTYDTK